MKFTKIFTILFLLFLITSCSKSKKNSISILPKKTLSKEQELIKQNPNEVAESLKPNNSKVIHKVIETEIWAKKNVIIAFYESKYINENISKNFEKQYIDCYFLIPINHKKHQKFLVNKFEDDNVDTKINSVFFANADNDKEKELIILTTCDHRLQYLYDGTEYYTSVFDNFDMNKIPKEIKYLTRISESLYGGFDGFMHDNKDSKAKFKNSNDIKNELKRLGY